MERLHDLQLAPWDHEPKEGTGNVSTEFWRTQRLSLPSFSVSSQTLRFIPRFMESVGLQMMTLMLVLLAAANELGAETWINTSQGRSRSVQPQVTLAGKAGFTLLRPEQTGVTFTNVLSEAAAAENQIRLNGSGVALGDVDGDGNVDIFLCGLEHGNRLLRNLGAMRFEDITGRAGVECAGQFSTGAAFADVDGDGDLDLLVNGIGTGTRLFLNDGKGVFTEKQDSGLLRTGGATSMALADVDGDGDLDLYVANYRTTTIRTTGFALLNNNGKRSVRPEDRESLEMTPEGKILENGEADAFYINEGGGRFVRVAWTGGGFLDEEGKPLRKVPRDWGLSAMFRDINQDGLPDLYVCNDFHSPDRIWINTGEGTFRALPKLALRNTSTFSMSVDFADIDRDGRDDFFLADMLDIRRERRMAQFTAMEPNQSLVGVYDDRPQYDRNTLHWNRGDGTYAEVAHYAGIEAAGWTWCAAFVDVDLDGFEDLLFTTGHMFDTQDLDAAARIQAMGPWRTKDIPKKLLMFPRLNMPKFAFRNTGALKFVDTSLQWGFNDEGVAHGMALGDLDNDGDLDVVVNNLNGVAGVYRNESDRPRVGVRLRGLAGNTTGVGARVSLDAGGFVQSQEMICGGRYLSSDEPLRVFAFLTNVPTRIEVRWRSGAMTVVSNVEPNRVYELAESTAMNGVVAVTAPSRPLFSEATTGFSHRHMESEFDDFARQPLLPNRLSQPGPGVVWFDADGDGWEDLWIGGGRGGRETFFRNDDGRGFLPLKAVPETILARDQVSGVAPADRMLITAQSSYENGADGEADILQTDLATGKSSVVLQGLAASVGPLVLTDLDADGTLEMFVGGRVVPGRYPEAASSVVLRQRSGHWEADAVNSKVLDGVGCVSGAVASDLNGDGYPDLILAVEWGPMRVFLNNHGTLTDATDRLGLSKWTGWWNGVTTADLDEDGRPDIIASNWGLNSKYRATPQHPRRLYYGDYDADGTLDLVEAADDLRLGRDVPERDLDSSRKAMPGIMARFESYSSYATAGVSQVLGPKFSSARKVEAIELASMVFFNRGDHFDAVPLPVEAQFSPSFAVVASDFDGDGHQDVFLGQNFFAVQPTTSRNDAGRGLLLRGDGHGGLRPVAGMESGLRIYGEQRGAAAADFDHDGRMDLVVTQNGAETKLYHNVGASAGLRVRLQGPAGNPHGIGASVRIQAGDRVGSWQEVLAGSGYGSQNGMVLLFPMPGLAATIQTRWTGGEIVSSTLPANVGAVILKRNGAIESVPLKSSQQ